MKIKCYECKKLFEAGKGFYVERRVIDPESIPALTESTGYGYCCPKCAASHHILEADSELQDYGNYEETDFSVMLTSPDGGVRGELLRIRDVYGKPRVL